MRAFPKRPFGAAAIGLAVVVCFMIGFSGRGIRKAPAQPDEVRIRSLGVSPAGLTEAVDLLGSQGMVFRDHKPAGQFSTYASGSVGDIDGDRLSEVLIGAPGLFFGDRGKGYVVFGKPDWGREEVESLAGSPGLAEIDSVKDKDSLGITVAGLGDFSGDGRPDLALAALAGSLGFAGESYVVLGGGDLRGGPALGLAELGDRGVRIKGEFGHDYAVGLAPAGDFNGDGRRDLLITGGDATGAGNSAPARAYVVFGGPRVSWS